MAPTAGEILKNIPGDEEVEVVFPERTLLIDFERVVHGFLRWGESVWNPGKRLPILRVKGPNTSKWKNFEEGVFPSTADFEKVKKEK